MSLTTSDLSGRRVVFAGGRGYSIVLDSCSGRVYAFYENQRTPVRVSFVGGSNGGHSIYYLGPDIDKRVIAHFEGYCRNNGDMPAFENTCRRLAALTLAERIRQIDIDSLANDLCEAL